MDNIINKISEHMCDRLAVKIDGYALTVFKIPKWVFKHRILLKFYAWFFKLTINQKRNFSDMSTDYKFFKLKKKVGECKIKDIDLI